MASRRAAATACACARPFGTLSAPWGLAIGSGGAYAARLMDCRHPHTSSSSSSATATRWGALASASDGLRCRYSSSVAGEQAQEDQEEEHSDLHVQSVTTLLIEPEESAAEPTLQALDSFRPQRFNPNQSRRGAANDVEKARQKHWDQTLRRVSKAFNRQQLLKIAKTEIPSLDIASLEADPPPSSSPSKKKRGQKRKIPKALAEGAKKLDIIRLIMIHHWKMQDPRAQEQQQNTAASRTATTPALPRTEPTEWLFYPLDKAQLFIVLTALHSPLSQLANQYGAKFFAAQQEVTSPVEGEQQSTNVDPAQGKESADSTAPALTQQGIQITGYSAGDLEAIKKWLDEELSYLHASSIDLRPIYAATSEASLATPESKPASKLLPSTYALQQIALRTGSYIESEASPAEAGQTQHDQTAQSQHQARYRVVIATSPSEIHGSRALPLHPMDLMRQYAAEHRDDASRPLYIYSPTTPASLSTNLTSDEQASSKTRTHYAFAPHYSLKSRDFMYNLDVEEQTHDLRKTTASRLPEDWVNQQLANKPALQEQAQEQLRHNPFVVGGAAVKHHWRLERSMVTDAFEGRGGLGYSLGYGSDLDLERARAAQGQDEDADGLEQGTAVEGVTILKDVEPGVEPSIFLAAPTSLDSSVSASASVLDHLLDVDTSSSSGKTQQHIYSATFGHLRFPSGLPIEDVWNRDSMSRTQMHAIFHPPLSGSWPINKLQRALISNEAAAPSTPSAEVDDSTTDPKVSSHATSWWSQPQRPTFIPALPPIALLPPSSVSSTLSGIKSVSPAGDAWTRLLSRAFGDLPNRLGNQPPWMSQDASGDSGGHSAALMAGLSKRPGWVLVEALKWMRAFKRRKQQQQDKMLQRERGQVADQAETTGTASVDVVTPPIQRTAGPEVDDGAKVEAAGPDADENAAGKGNDSIDVSERHASLPTEEDISRFTYVPITAEDRIRASGQRLVVEAASRYTKNGALLPEFDVLRAYWEAESRQADVAVPDASTDLRMSSITAREVAVEDVLSSEQLRSFFDGQSTEPGAITITSSRIPMVHCYYHSMAAPSSISFPTAPDEGVDAAAQAGIQLQLENVQVLSRTTWSMPDTAPAPGPIENSPDLRAWVVEELVYVPGSPDAVSTMRIEWRTSHSSGRPTWSQLAEDLDLLLDVPYGVCKGRPTLAPL